MNFIEHNKNEFVIANFLVLETGGFMGAKSGGMDKKKDIRVFVPKDIEVKTDWDAERTGNVFLEMFNCYRNEPSGLTATNADIWAHFVPPNHLFTFRPRAMIKHLTEIPSNAVGYRKIERGGDNNSSGFIVSIENLRLLPFVRKYETDFILRRPNTSSGSVSEANCSEA